MAPLSGRHPAPNDSPRSSGARALCPPRAAWTRWTDGHLTCWFSGYLLNPDREGPDAAATIAGRLGRLALDELFGELARLDGRFAFVLEDDARCIGVVDRVRSVPLFAASGSGGCFVGPDAQAVRDAVGLGWDDRDAEAALPLAMSGFTLGNRTLYRGLQQLRAGEAVAWEGGAPQWRRYYRYEPWRADEVDDEQAGEELGHLLLRGCERLARSADGRPILIPLSAGMDSRTLASGLRQVGYDKVVCFAYGPPGNHEAAVSREVARRLGYPWFFVRVTHRDMAAHFASDAYATFLDYADGCTNTPMLQDYGALAWLARRGWPEREPVLVNGQTGDFISGGHVPSSLAARVGDPGLVRRRTALVDALVAKHYSLWGELRTPERLERLAALLIEDLDLADPLALPPELDWTLFEHSEWQNRQSQFVLSGQRVYEHFGFRWRLPLWDVELMDFWARMPLRLKRDRFLLRTTMERVNWGGVWRDLPERRYVSPRWVRAVRPVLKTALAPAGRRAWWAFDHHALAYWMEMQGQIALVPYTAVLRDRRGWRHAVSFLTEAYLARHGFDWTGRPVPV